MNALQRRVLELAAGELGVRVEMYQAAAGGVPGEPYCVDFIIWCFKEAVHELNVEMPLPVVRSAVRLWQQTDPWTHWHAPSPGSIPRRAPASRARTATATASTGGTTAASMTTASSSGRGSST
ncbi:MAG: hypothetical protein LC640_09100 [Frankia sp.]|nr:hypothetical protein [Frankia sp.]